MNIPIEHQILTGMEEIIKTIRQENGYWTTISPDSVLRKHLTIDMDGPCENPESYPYVIINTGRADFNKMIGGKKEGVYVFPVVVYVYDLNDVDLKLSQLLKDIERRVEEENLNGFPLDRKAHV